MIYFIQDQRTCEIKIGFTGDCDARSRMRALQTGNPGGLVLLHMVPGEKADEDRLHQRFKGAHERGEWFRPVPELLLFVLEEVGKASAADAVRRCEMEAIPTACHVLQADDSWCPSDNHPHQVGPNYVLTCPICGLDYNHHAKTKEVEWHGRGGSETLSFWGECGHAWSLTFGFHKGNMYVFSTHDPMDDERLQNELADSAV